jgi:acetylornithine aminotransferase
LQELEKKYLLGNYSSDGVRVKPGLYFTHGKESTLYGSDGKAYLDFAAGIAVNSIGHSDPEWAKVVGEQATKLAHISNLFHSMEPLELAKMMVESSKHFTKVFFANSGTEANEGALKFARKVSLVKAQQKKLAKLKDEKAANPSLPPFTPNCKKAEHPTKCLTQGGVCGCWPQVADNDIANEHKTEFIAFKASFHGRSMGALAVTHKPQIRQQFGPFGGDVKFARFNNLKDVEAVISKKTAAIIVEPVQGEGGINPATQSFMKGLRDLADEHGALLIVDEVQCGLGRTGRLWAHEAYHDAKPDIMTLAKPLAGGLPIGAVMMTDEVAACIAPGDHGTTYGGNPFVTKAAQVVFKRVSDPSFLAASRERGLQLINGMKALQKKYPTAIAEVRHAADNGLFVGVQLTMNPKPIVSLAAEKGLLIITCGENTLRLCPALNISSKDIAHGLKVLGEVFEEVVGESEILPVG